MKVLFVDTNHPSLIEGLQKLGFVCEEDYDADKSDNSDGSDIKNWGRTKPYKKKRINIATDITVGTASM